MRRVLTVKRKAWLAAVERSLWVIEHYPQAPQLRRSLADCSLWL